LCTTTGSTATLTDGWETGLAARISRGDHAALAEAFDQFSPFLCALARRVTGDRVAAEDVVQEVFLRLSERPEAFDAGRGSLRAFLRVMAHRRAVDWVRREAAAHRRQQDPRSASGQLAPDVAEAAAAMVLAERVRAAVHALPVDQRDAVRLAYFGGRTYRQVAEILGISEGTAKSRLRLALVKLYVALQDDDVSGSR
jgi:RNA polymerase sigma factor (sigma-70 family)